MQNWIQLSRHFEIIWITKWAADLIWLRFCGAFVFIPKCKPSSGRNKWSKQRRYTRLSRVRYTQTLEPIRWSHVCVAVCVRARVRVWKFTQHQRTFSRCSCFFSAVAAASQTSMISRVGTHGIINRTHDWRILEACYHCFYNRFFFLLRSSPGRSVARLEFGSVYFAHSRGSAMSGPTGVRRRVI